MESKSTAFKSADAVIKQVVRRGLTEDYVRNTALLDLVELMGVATA